MDPVKTGNVIRTVRKNMNLTQKELASKIYVSDKAISKWERGLCFPDITVLIPLSETLNVDLYEILGGEKLTEEKKNDVLKETIEFTSKEIKKTRKTYLRSLSAIIIVLVVFIAVYYFGFIKESVVKYDKQLIEVVVPIDGGLDIHVNLANYKNGNAVLVKTSNQNYDIYINVTQTLSSKIFSNNDTKDNFIRYGNNICFDFKTSRVRFYAPTNAVINSIYYVEKEINSFIYLTDSELVNLDEKTLIWENDN